jgi:hypothetical protein
MKLIATAILLSIAFAGFAVTSADAYYRDSGDIDDDARYWNQGKPTTALGSSREGVGQTLGKLRVDRKIAVVNRLSYSTTVMCYAGSSRIGPYTLGTGDSLAFGFTKSGLTTIGAECDVWPNNRRFDKTDFDAWNSDDKPSVYNLRDEGIFITDDPNNDKGTLRTRWDWED